MEINAWSKYLKIFYKRHSFLLSSPFIFKKTGKRFEFCFWIWSDRKQLHLDVHLGTWWLEW